MKNYRLSIDISDIFFELRRSNISLSNYSQPFMLLFIEADNPDDACYLSLHRLIIIILKSMNNIEGRILCRKVRKSFRIDKITAL